MASSNEGSALNEIESVVAGERNMQFARVIGNVVATQKDEKIQGWKMLILQPLNIRFEPAGNVLVAADAVGAGDGELVLYASGSSARLTRATEGKPCDCVILAIVDLVEKEGRIVYNKSEMG
jgi:microcompartment protein CcmK/EutM